MIVTTEESEAIELDRQAKARCELVRFFFNRALSVANENNVTVYVATNHGRVKVVGDKALYIHPDNKL